MEGVKKISEDFTIGAQPEDDEFDELARAGFKSVINLRREGEEEQPLSPDDEAVRVRELGMQYVHIPVSSSEMETGSVDRFRETLARLPRPVFVHCRGGKRAGALVMMHQAIENKMTGEQTLQVAEQMGFKCDMPELKAFVKSYIDNNRKP